MANLKTLTQKYALYAFECIEEVKTKNIGSDYVSTVKKIPAMITHNGLLTTLTFLYSKSDKEPKLILLNQIVYCLKNPSVTKPKELSKDDIKDFIYQLAKEDFQKLMFYSQKALTLSQWLKRLAEGEFGDE
jgi:CRISPR-associated protein Cmr5